MNDYKSLSPDYVKLNSEYGLSFGAYWMIYAVIGSFASVFMLAKGYTNTHIGMTLAAANLITLATIASSLIGGWILDISGVKALTGVASLITAAGAIIIIMSIDKIQSHS